MRLSNFFIVAAAVASLVASGNALSTADHTKVSAMAPPNAIKAVQNDGGDAKRFLRAVESADEKEDDHIEEERGKWDSLAKYFPGTAAKKAANAAKEEKKMASLASTFASYKTSEWEPLDAYNAVRSLGYSKTKAMNYGYRYEKYLRAHEAY